MHNKLKCVVLDDNLFDTEVIKDHLSDSTIAQIVATFQQPEKLLNAFSKLNFDLLLLDISMDNISGFEVAERLSGTPIIFITGVSENLQKATEYAPIDIITKPLERKRLLKGLEKANKLRQDSYVGINSYQLFNVAKTAGKVKILTSDILFARADEKDRRHKHVVLKSGKKLTLLYCTFEKLLLYSSGLIRVNKSELISLEALDQLEYDVVTLNFSGETGNPKQVTLSRVYRQNLIDRLSTK